MILVIIAILLFAVLAGILYRFGGSSGGVRWAREVGEGVTINFAMLLLGIWNLGSLACLGSVWIESTYLKIKGEVNWYLVGLTFSIATLPWFLWTGFYQHKWHWLGYGLRIVVCCAFVGVWQNYISDKVAKLFGVTKDKTDEGGRGAIQILTLPLLLL